jgi:hypothetical protein
MWEPSENIPYEHLGFRVPTFRVFHLVLHYESNVCLDDVVSMTFAYTISTMLGFCQIVDNDINMWRLTIVFLR